MSRQPSALGYALPLIIAIAWAGSLLLVMLSIVEADGKRALTQPLFTGEYGAVSP